MRILRDGLPRLKGGFRMLNILVPIAGPNIEINNYPKPLVEIYDKSLIELVTKNVDIAEPHQFTFVVNREDYDKFYLGSMLRIMEPTSNVVIAEGDTAGALCSALLAVDYIDNDDPLLIISGDQYLRSSYNDFYAYFTTNKVDGGIVTFHALHPKWSYVKLDEAGNVVEVAEKRVISNLATAGIFYFKTGRLFVECAQGTIKKGKALNGKYYISEVYNELILKNMKIVSYTINHKDLFKLNTPEQIAKFQELNIVG